MVSNIFLNVIFIYVPYIKFIENVYIIIFRSNVFFNEYSSQKQTNFRSSYEKTTLILKTLKL